jgi:acetyltransferase-like isoleucine patch superfamily enzyme
MAKDVSPQYDYSQLKACGEDVFISSNVEIRRPHLVRIGSHVAIDSGFYCTVAAEIGDYVHIGPYVTVIGGENGLLRMGNFTTIAAGSRIICVGDEHLGEGLVGPTVPEKYRDRVRSAPVVFEDFASVATNVVIFPGVTLREGSVVGAGSVVTKSTEPWTVYVGIPSKPKKARRKTIMIKMAQELGYSHKE